MSNSKGFMGWLGGIAAAVITAVVIAWLIPGNPDPVHGQIDRRLAPRWTSPSPTSSGPVRSPSR